MAGYYMNAPNHRLAYDRDGSIGVVISAAGSMTALSPTSLASLNDENESGVTLNQAQRLVIVFPVPVDLTSVFLALSTSAEPTIQTSKDSTTGADGTWTANVPTGLYLRDVRPHYRVAANLTPLLATSVSQEVRAIRISFPANVSGVVVRGLHIYGQISSSATTDRLSFRDPGSDVEVGPAHFDWGNVPRGTSADKTFRVKNLSSTLTAKDVDVYPEALTPGSPSVASMHLFSLNGTTFTASVNLGDLAPGEISDVIYVRRTVPTNAQVSVWSARLIAEVDSWV